MPGDGRQNCCRLCLAPDSECISILNSYAADKEPLTTKIQNCVHIKVTPDDGMSLRICHACISYLNSWQSFKNRCVAAQNKQKNWLEFSKRQHLGDNNVSISTISATSTTAHRQQHPQQQHQKHQPDQEQFSQEASLASSILDGITSLKKRRSLTVYPLPAIKDEPIDDDDYEALKQPHDESDEMVVDPTMFLERHEEEGTEPFMTHVHSSIQDTSNYGYEPSHLAGTPAPDRTTIEVAAAAEVKEASCRACNLKFSTRANARRHERNLHPTLFELSSSANNSTLVTKPTAALAAALEMQRSTAGGSGVSDIVKKSFASFTSAGSSVGAASASQRVRPQFTDSNTTSDTGFDYDNPEKYRDLLTDEKIVFLQQNEEFLQQYQTMTCKCCRKFYVSYKNFMAHMRKKYVTLPRNVCFNCLKLNDSKALFISHLKRRNCINLYKVMHSLMARQPTFAAAVAATTAAMPEKLRAKELLVNKIYECKLCTKFFRLKLEFRSHVYDEHADAQKKDVSPGQCSFCGLEIEDPSERKRHYNNMDCIVTLRCVTCDDKFSNHQKFLDHVYARHLVQPLGGMEQRQRQQSTVSTGADIYAGKKQNASLFGGATSSADEFRSSSAQSHAAPKSQYFSRMPQACPICGQQYNNYNNVLRHMESKHPDQLPQTYKCVKCGNGYPRLSNLREHMLTVHSGAANNEKTRSTSFEYIVNADAVKTIDGSGGPNVSGGGGRYDYVMKDLMSITNGGTVEADEEDDSGHGQAMKKIRLDSTTNNSGTASAAGGGSSAPNSFKECPICNAIFSNNIGLSNHMRSHTAAAQNFAGPVPSAFRDTAHHGTDRPASSPATASAVPMSMQPKASAQFFKHSLKLAADRRFRRMRCRICQKRFSSKKSYRRHMLDDHQIRNVQFIKCKLCDAEFAYEKGLKVHMFKIHNTLLKDEMIIKQYECDICSIVYRTEEQLLQHKKSVHGNENAHPDDFTEMVAGAASAAGGSGGGNAAAAADIANVSNASQLDSAPAVSAPLYWYQCKYCPSNFNTNKKLAIHINSHDEFDSNDYSCKDCGNVYSGRKSLWVHRYKKHPQIAEPSECVLCRKVFFDSQMLENHIPTCNRKPITATGAVAELPTSSNSFFRHKTGDDEEDDGSRGRTAATRDGQGSSAAAALANLSTEDHSANSKLKIKLPEVACTICGQRFTDQELFTKHIQMHEMELYTDNPLAAMFDTGPADPNQFYLDRVNDNGEYVCDICTKAFTQMTALKVHRKWHFRGDSKQNPAEGDLSASTTSQTQSLPHPPGLQAVGLVPNPRPSKSLKRKRELKCEYCPSTFISNNNLRRHIYELHKSEIAHLPEPPKIKLDDNLHCRKCALKFETKKDWIDHKVADARLMKPYGPFQWGCEMCGEYVSRKEKLIHHIQSHMKEQIVVPAHLRKQQEEQRQQESTMATKNSIEDYGADSNSQDSQQTDENDVAAKNDEEQDYEEDDGGADYLVDEEEEQDEEDDDDEDDDVDDDDGGGYVNSSNVIKREQIHATKRADVDNGRKVENMDDNANDGQRGNDEYLEDDVDEEEEDDDLDEDDSDDMNDLEKRKLMGQSNTTNYVNASAVEDSMQSRNDDDVDEDDDDDDDDEDDEDEGDDEEDEEEEEEEEAADESVQRVNEYADDDVDDDDRDDVENHATSEKKSRFACDLCQVFFDTQLELQKHVKIHFLNGPGSVTLTEIRAKEVNTSRGRVDSDAMSVSSS